MSFRLLLQRFYRGEISADIVGRPKLWYSISGALVLFSLVGLFVVKLSFGVEFTGGTVFTINAPDASISQVREAVSAKVGGEPIVQKAGDDWRVTTETLTISQVQSVTDNAVKEFGPSAIKGNEVVGSSWGGEVSKKAWQALFIFMILIIAYLSVA
ncbi:MAG: protein translocase subunit SecF, partial [Streptosporangiaceae bacterium]